MPQKKSNTVSMNVLRPDAAGVDIGSRTIHVALPPSRNQSVREFETFTSGLHQLKDWLLEHGITTVAMESTGVLWVPVFEILEPCGIEVFLVNALHVKAVPGRKTDIQDCQWIQHLHSVGLLDGSFRPEDEIVAIRSMTRHRATLVQSAARCIQRMQKSLSQMNVKIHNVISDITGLTGMAIIDAIIDGQYDPDILAELKHGRIRASKQTIRKSLEGNYRTEHLFTLRQERDAYLFFQKQIDECDETINATIREFNRKRGEMKPYTVDSSKCSKKLQLRTYRDSRIHAEMYQAFGVDLFKLPGFSTETVITVFTEVGPDFGKFRSEAAFASWLCLCPNNQITGGKVQRSKTRKTKSRLSAALRRAANSLHHAQSYYGDLFRRLRAKYGAVKAITAMANRLARLLYHIVSTNQDFDQSKYVEAANRHRERQIKALKRRSSLLGFTLIPTS